jgi:hypothetical protein
MLRIGQQGSRHIILQQINSSCAINRGITIYTISRIALSLNKGTLARVCAKRHFSVQQENLA